MAFLKGQLMGLDRRDFLKLLGGGAICAAAAPSRLYAGNGAAAGLAKPTPEQRAWQDLEIGAFYHFDPPHPKRKGKKPETPPAGYDPKKLDTDQWIDAAKLMGAAYAVFTAKHGSGFLQWQSDAYAFGCKQAIWQDGKGDVVRDFVDSCRKAGIKPGIYCHVMWSPQFGVRNGKVNWGRGGDARKQKEYAAVCMKMLAELWSNYGELTEIWFDGGVLPVKQGGPDIAPLARKLQPKAMYFQGPAGTIRWIGNEYGMAGYPCWATVPSRAAAERSSKVRHHGDPNGKLWLPGECDVPLPGRGWNWSAGQNANIKPLPKLMEIYYRSVGRNCNLLLNVAPNFDGLVPKGDLKHYADFGKEIKSRFGKPVAETKGRGRTVELAMPRPARIDHVIIMEEIAQGERVRKYVVEGKAGGDKWQKLCEGESVGHKRIQQFKAQEVAAVRVRATESAGVPLIRRLAVFDTSG